MVQAGNNTIQGSEEKKLSKNISKQGDQINKQQQLAQAAALIPGEGTAAAALIEAKTARDRQKLQSKKQKLDEARQRRLEKESKKARNEAKRTTSDKTNPSQDGAWIHFTIIILGLLIYILRVVTGEASSLALFISWFVIFPLAGYALANKLEVDRYTILLPMLIFAVWFHVFDRNVELKFLTLFISVSIAILALPTIFTKGKAIKPELFGLLPILFVFLDSGLLAFLTENLSFIPTGVTTGLILYMPWWVVFGVLSLPDHFTASPRWDTFFGILKIVTFIWIVLTFVVPFLPDIGHETFGPSLNQLTDAQKRFQEQQAGREHPTYSFAACTWEQLNQQFTTQIETTTINDCITTRQKAARWHYACKQQGHQKSSKTDSPYQLCLKQQELDTKSISTGKPDSNIKEPTTASVVFTQKKPYPDDYDPLLGYEFKLEVKNPRKQKITAEASCKLIAPKGKKNVTVLIKGGSSIEFTDLALSTTFDCVPVEKFEGRYKLEAQVSLLNLATASELERAFIGTKSTEEKERLRTAEIKPALEHVESVYPPELAAIWFHVGHSPGEFIIENKAGRKIKLSSQIRNLGPGKITNLREYSYTGFDGFVVENIHPELDCLQGFISNFETSKKDSYPLPSCFVTDYPDNLRSPEDWKSHSFTAKLVYDYTLTSKKDITVKADTLGDTS
jgi:hypothetical protein